MAWLRSQSFESRLSTLVAAAVGITVALASVIIYVAVSHRLQANVNQALRGDLSRCAPTGGQQLNPGCLLEVAHAGGVVAVFDSKGQNLSSQVFGGQMAASFLANGPAVKPTAAQLALSTEPSPTDHTSTADYGGKPYRVLADPVSITTTNRFTGVTSTSRGVLLVAQPLKNTIANLERLRIVLIFVVVLGIAIAVLLGLVVARAVMRPVRRLTAAAEHVTVTQDLDAAIEEDGDDELARLARAFNDMLAALRGSRQQQAQLVSDAGHELRTPLTSLRTNVEFLMRAGELPEAERAEILADVRSQLEEMTALVGDIVETARQDEQGRELTEARLDDIVTRAVGRARRRAPSLQFDVQTAPGLVRGQPSLLERAVLNVLDNAAKWSPAGGTVTVRLRREDRWVLEVRDQGPGIAADDLPRVFDRFYRAPTARSMPGSGLGLAIVRQVVEDHGGVVAIAGAPGGGTLVRMELPTVEEEEPSASPADTGGSTDGWASTPPAPPWPAPVGSGPPPGP